MFKQFLIALKQNLREEDNLSLQGTNGLSPKCPLFGGFTVLGDLNADIWPSGGPYCTSRANEQGWILQRYLLNWNQVSAHLNIPQSPPSPSHTRPMGPLQAYVDHILCPKHLPLIVQCHPLDEDPLNTSDHLPLICHINLHLQPHSPPKITPTSHPKPSWKKVSTQEIHDTYTRAVETTLGSIPLSALSVLISNPLEIDSHLHLLASILSQTALT